MAATSGSSRPSYATDLTDAQWKLIDPILPPPNLSGRHEKHPRREIVNAILYVSEQLAYTTVMTVLARLHEKRLLDRVMAGRGYRYTPRFDEEHLIEHLGQQEVADLLDRYGTVALTQFVAALEDADPATLRRINDFVEGRGDG